VGWRVGALPGCSGQFDQVFPENLQIGMSCQVLKAVNAYSSLETGYNNLAAGKEETRFSHPWCTRRGKKKPGFEEGIFV
jgi:hypothetical protein